MVIQHSVTGHTFRVYLPEAASVELVGTFTDWRSRPIAMTRESTGWWTATADLPAGDHDFSYLVNASTWVADYAASGVKRNAFGGWVSQLHVAHPEPVIAVVRTGVQDLTPLAA
jgi:1,4-alpha-glucan branching enzyme